MGSRFSEFNQSGTMTGRPGRGLFIAILLAALPVIAVAAIIIIRDRDAEAVVAPSTHSSGQAEQAFLNEPARATISPADLSAMRWRAMGEFYEKNGLLTGNAAGPDAAVDRFELKNGITTSQNSGSSSVLSDFTVAPSADEVRAYEPAARATSSLNVSPAAVWGPEQEYNLLLREKAAHRSLFEPVSARDSATLSGADLAEEVDAYYTERYWKMAVASEPIQAPAEEVWDFYTERYWAMAAESQPAQAPVEPEWDYYTERYWELGKK